MVKWSSPLVWSPDFMVRGHAIHAMMMVPGNIMSVMIFHLIHCLNIFRSTVLYDKSMPFFLSPQRPASASQAAGRQPQHHTLRPLDLQTLDADGVGPDLPGGLFAWTNRLSGLLTCGPLVTKESTSNSKTSNSAIDRCGGGRRVPGFSEVLFSLSPKSLEDCRGLRWGPWASILRVEKNMKRHGLPTGGVFWCD